jgi:hypothetical protein
MAYFYAQLNENNICIGVSRLSGPAEAPNMIQIDTLDTDKIWRKYENGAWSTEKFEPQSTALLTEFQQLRADVDQLIISSLEV